MDGRSIGVDELRGAIRKTDRASKRAVDFAANERRAREDAWLKEDEEAYEIYMMRTGR
jgi:hypothetical protein